VQPRLFYWSINFPQREEFEVADFTRQKIVSKPRKEAWQSPVLLRKVRVLVVVRGGGSLTCGRGFFEPGQVAGYDRVA